MVHSPSKRWEDGVLVERAIPSPYDDDPEEVEPKATRPYKTPVPTKHGVEEKQVESAENKAVARASKRTARK